MIAVIDCGSNTTRLAIATKQGEVIVREIAFTALGKGVDASGNLSKEGIRKSIDAVAHFVEIAKAKGVEHFTIAATSAVRDSSNSNEFIEEVHARVGLMVEVLGGETEAELSFLGATIDRSETEKILLVDIGGGSAELSFGQAGRAPVKAESYALGALRLTERFTDERTGLINADALVAHVNKELQHSEAIKHAIGISTVVAVAGTATSIAAVDLDLTKYEPGLVHNHRVTYQSLENISQQLSRADSEEIMRRFASIPKERAWIIGAGSLVLRCVVSHFGRDGFIASECDILDGLLYRKIKADF